MDCYHCLLWGKRCISSFCSVSVLILHSFCSYFAELSYSALLLLSFCSHSTLILLLLLTFVDRARTATVGFLQWIFGAQFARDCGRSRLTDDIRGDRWDESRQMREQTWEPTDDMRAEMRWWEPQSITPHRYSSLIPSQFSWCWGGDRNKDDRRPGRISEDSGVIWSRLDLSLRRVSASRLRASREFGFGGEIETI